MTTTGADPEVPRDDSARRVEIVRESVELFKVLKFEGLVASGGQAKTVIANGLVTVNGVVEQRKRRQIRAGDRIAFAEQTLLIRLETDSQEQAGSADSGS